MASAQLLKTRNSYDDGSTIDPYNAPWQSGVYRKGYRAKATDPVVPVAPNPGPITTPSATSSSGRPVTFKPANPDTGVNAKTIDFTRAGEGNRVYGVTAENVYQGIDKIRAAGDQKAGGNAQLWGNLQRFTSTDNAQHLDPQQAAAYNDFIKTGVRGAGLKDSTTLAATDWALRDIGRSQQHKPEGFMDSVFGKILLTAAEIGISLTPAGPLGAAALGAAVGGATHGFKGAIMGGISGYGVGSATNWVADGGLSALTAPANGAGITATGGGTGVANAVTNVSSAAKGALGSVSASTALSAVSTGISLRDALVGGAGAALVGATATTPSALNRSPVTTPPEAGAQPTPADREAEMVRRRKASQVATNLTWDRALQAPMLSKPTLLGGPTRLAA